MKAEWTNSDSLTTSQTTKALLVIDLPKNCAKCKLMYLQGIGESICNAVDWEERPSWCSLRPLPQKREPKEEWLNEYHRDEFADGWNACLKELEK